MVVAVEVNAAGGLEDAAHFNQPYGHKRQVTLHPGAGRKFGRFTDAKHPGVNELYLVQPLLLVGVHFPDVVEPNPQILAVAERVKIPPLGIKRRVKINQIYAIIVQFPHYVQIVRRKNCAIVHIGKHTPGRIGSGIHQQVLSGIRLSAGANDHSPLPGGRGFRRFSCRRPAW